MNVASCISYAIWEVFIKLMACSSHFFVAALLTGFGGFVAIEELANVNVRAEFSDGVVLNVHFF